MLYVFFFWMKNPVWRFFSQFQSVLDGHEEMFSWCWCEHLLLFDLGEVRTTIIFVGVLLVCVAKSKWFTLSTCSGPQNLWPLGVLGRTSEACRLFHKSRGLGGWMIGWGGGNTKMIFVTDQTAHATTNSEIWSSCLNLTSRKSAASRIAWEGPLREPNRALCFWLIDVDENVLLTKYECGPGPKAQRFVGSPPKYFSPYSCGSCVHGYIQYPMFEGHKVEGQLLAGRDSAGQSFFWASRYVGGLRPFIRGCLDWWDLRWFMAICVLKPWSPRRGFEAPWNQVEKPPGNVNVWQRQDPQSLSDNIKTMFFSKNMGKTSQLTSSAILPPPPLWAKWQSLESIKSK